MSGMFASLNTSASGLTAQRMRMDVISNNIANVNTTRTTAGGPFQRSRVILRPRNDKLRFISPILPNRLKTGIGEGVNVVKVAKDNRKPRLKYDPSHPDAIKFGDKKGYVQMPNVNVVEEMVDLISATRSYEANITMIQGTKQMFNKALEIGR
ncbi:MAG: flagellar basal body rod protein FlgC [Spirochaetes bacterium]|nr:flagellar basal body rod protein FlgC [Spirochaetota bacterium]